MNVAARKLSNWLKSEGIPKGVFANRVNVGAPTVSRLLNGERTPGLELATRIFEQTDGFVNPNEWLCPVETCAEHTAAA